jgi:hypothetical protein
MNVKQPQSDATIRRVTVSGRGPRLGIAEWGFADEGGGPAVSTMRQTKPIPAEEASALMMDWG